MEPRDSGEPTLKKTLVDGPQSWYGRRFGKYENLPNKSGLQPRFNVLSLLHTVFINTLRYKGAAALMRRQLFHCFFRFSNSSFSRGCGFRSASRFRSLTVTSAIPHANFQYYRSEVDTLLQTGNLFAQLVQ